MREGYTDGERILVVLMRFRDYPRPAPWGAIAAALRVPDRPTVMERLLWGIVTGYPTCGVATGPRREAPVWTRGAELSRSGQQWHRPEDDALRCALAGDGQKRDPVVDVDYIAQVFARTPEEVAVRWAQLKEDALGRGVGFGIA